MSNLEEAKKKGISWSQIVSIVLMGAVVIWLGIRIALPDIPTIFAGIQPDNLGVKQGKLAQCPSTPNCVSSQRENPEHYIAPLVYQQSNVSETMTKLKEAISNQPRTQIIAQSDNYLYAQFTSRWFGFVDDVEFYFNPDQPGVIEVRSASRLGESDLGVNRQRIEMLREYLES